MKPTDEAKRLRDEIAKKEFESHYLNDYEISWLVNKVLDRVVLNIRAEGGPIAPLDSLDIGFDEGIDVAIKVIDKLRP